MEALVGLGATLAELMAPTDMHTPTGLVTGEALPPDIRAIVINRINNNQNSLRLIDRVKADHREQ
jgi:hypothetical protein